MYSVKILIHVLGNLMENLIDFFLLYGLPCMLNMIHTCLQRRIMINLYNVLFTYFNIDTDGLVTCVIYITLISDMYVT